MRLILLFLFLCLSNFLIGQDLSKGLLLHYKFDGDAQDYSGNNFHGSAVRTTPTKDRNGINNMAFHFNGSSFVDMPNVPELHPNLPITIAFWMNIDNFNQKLIPLFITDFNMNVYYGIFSSLLSSSKKIGVGYGDGGSIFSGSRRSKGSSEVIKPKTWYHIVLVLKGALDMDIYINGCPSPGHYSGSGNRRIKYAGNHGTIGRLDSDNAPGPIYYLHGSIDEFYMWNRALTSAEVASLYFKESANLQPLGDDIEVCTFDSKLLDPGAGFKSYRWQDGSRMQTYLAKGPGLYWVEVEDRCGNIFRDSIRIKLISPPPFPSIPDTTICLGDSLRFSISAPPYNELDWYSDKGLECQNCPTFTIPPSDSGRYIIKARTPTGCEVIDTFWVHLLPPRVASLGPDTSICQFESKLLSPGEGFQSYVWQDGSTAPQYLAKKPGVYWVTTEDDCGNVSTDSILIHLLTPPPLTPIRDTSICQGQEIVFQITDPNYNSFDWYSDLGQDCMDCPILKVTPDQSDRFILTAHTPQGCERKDTFFVDVIPPSYSFDTLTKCVEDTIILMDSLIFKGGDYDFHFISGSGCDSILRFHIIDKTTGLHEEKRIICPGDSAFIFDEWRYTSGDYSTIYPRSGCDSQSIVHLIVVPPITTDLPSYKYICDTTASTTLHVHTKGGISPLTFQWNGQSGDSVQMLGQGPQQLVIIDSIGCRATFEIEILPTQKPDYTILTEDVLCFGDTNGSISIEVPSGNTDVLYSLGDKRFTRQPPYLQLSPGSYTIYAKDSLGCLYADTIEISQPDSLTLTLPPDTTIVRGEIIPLYAKGNFDRQNTQYLWSPPDGLSCTDCPNPTAHPLKTTTYQLTITNNNGCTITRSLTIYINDSPKVYIPNVFTPNGDQINDRFTLFANGNIKEVLTMEIYDRWGELIFRNASFPPNETKYGWDGTFKGRRMNPGVFVYTFKVLLFDGSTVNYAGNVTLMR